MKGTPFYKRKENGNAIDLIASVFVVAFIFALILSYACYGKTVQERLAIDNIAKKYLYRMEENGYMLPAEKDMMVADLGRIGATVEENGWTVTTSSGTYVTDESQVTYGDTVTLACKVKFPNPFYQTFGTAGAFFRMNRYTEEYVSYEIVMSSTSKW